MATNEIWVSWDSQYTNYGSCNFPANALGLGIYLSNAMGYVVGIVFSFIANTIFTFTQPISINRLIKFLCVCFICYVANIIVIKIFFVFMPEKIYSAQILGMFTYTITGFILNKFWAMK
ncbi:GtrA family protein [Klebsiella pneumoniae]|nr:GtrA family protein [Klebsiella pneumoniae]